MFDGNRTQGYLLYYRESIFFLEILGIINVNIATNTYYIVLIIYFKILILPVDACIRLIIITLAMTKSINYEGSHGTR